MNNIVYTAGEWVYILRSIKSFLEAKDILDFCDDSKCKECQFWEEDACSMNNQYHRAASCIQKEGFPHPRNLTIGLLREVLE